MGGFLGQVAKRLGAGKVLGTVGNPEKAKLAASFGYDELFVRSEFAEKTLKSTGQKGVHVVFDPVGGSMRKQSLEVLCLSASWLLSETPAVKRMSRIPLTKYGFPTNSPLVLH
ncbi:MULTISPECIES: zinc-binding dehydrogenase [Paenibacillus]|uniref:zinc-binding dehydrogenase n=1 Tax=Paenibacillus TaxID=44249 RepID=UPI0004BB308D|nr:MULTISPECIES: zinc-binding dehydrogenase [Paenibacillus]